MLVFNLLDNIFKILYIFLVFFSVFGIVYLAKRRKVFIVVLSIILLSLFWRLFSYSDSSRYFSILIIYSIFLMGYGVIGLFHHLPSDIILRQALFFILMFLLLYTNTTKVFGSFNNKYLIDSCEIVDSCLKNNPNCIVYINHKELARIGRKLPNIETMPAEILSSNKNVLHLFYITENLLGKEVYFIDFEKKSGSEDIFDHNMYVYKLASFFADSKHKKRESIYKHVAFIPDPGIDIGQLYEDAVLKAYLPEYDTFVYLVNDKLVWLIGTEIESKTEIVFHLCTDKPELLPPPRIKYKFDNLGFRYYGKEQNHIGKYVVLEKTIPSEYPVTQIRVGFNTDGEYIRRIFYLHDDKISDNQ